MSNEPSDPNEPNKSTDRPVDGNGDGKTDSTPVEKTGKRGHHIPEFPKQAVLTSEQEQQKQREHLRRESVRSFTQRLRNSLFGLAIVAILVVLVFLAIRTDGSRPKETTKTEGPKIATDFEMVLTGDNPQRIMQYSESLDVGFLEAPLPSKVAVLKKKLRIGKRLMQLNFDENSYTFGINARMDALIMLDTMNLVFGLKEKGWRPQLVELAGESMNNDDEDLRRKAHMAMCLAMTHDYTIEKSDASFDVLMEQVKKSIDTVGNDVVSASGLQKFATLVDLAEREEHSAEYRRVLGVVFKQSESDEIRSIGAQMHDGMLLSRVNYDELSQDILNRNQEALDRLDQMVDVVATSPLVSAVPYSKILTLVEDLGQIGKSELQDEYLAQLRSSIPAVDHEKTREQIKLSLQAYDLRQSLVGKTFDLTGKLADGTELDITKFDNKIVGVLFVSFNNKSSRDYVRQLQDLSYLHPRGVEFVLCIVDRPRDPELVEQLAAQNPELTFTTSDSAKNYVVQCPIAKVPYLGLMNREHETVNVNVKADDLRKRIEALIGN